MKHHRTQRTHHRTQSARMQTLAATWFARTARTLVYALRARHAHVHHPFVNMMFHAYTGVRAVRAVRALSAFMRVCMRAVMRAVHRKCVRSRARAFSLSFF